MATEISILNQSRLRIPPQKKLTGLLSNLYATLNIPLSAIELIFLTDQQIKPYYKKYFGENRPTDVIAFPLDASPPPVGGETGEGDLPCLGCIVISVETARRQAREHRHTLWQEIKFLIIHGFLHLLGYDHAETGEARRMKALEQRLLGVA